MEPVPSLVRSDGRELRERILSLSAPEAQRLSLGKSMLNYLKKHARDRKPFKIYNKVVAKLE